MDVYDGLDTRAPLIGRYCGQQRNVVIYSTEHHMLVTFTTLKRTADSQNRGFLAKYEFSESFVKLGKLFSHLVFIRLPCGKFATINSVVDVCERYSKLVIGILLAR